ncbi:WAT1-related protein [Cocos nucifera]|uniref:WAT1-related protein n=1 Tax=Cocos nucifera TaxID=13894 RepID=A0A8K0HWJ4_COCNU|nr:WAT1-related protein [Cocos nucifera]
MEGLKPAGGMVLVLVVFAGANIFYKLAINDGMDMRVLVAYRFLFASVFLGPLAFFLERLESLEIHSISGQAKVLGTLVGIGGAMLLTFYKGVDINLWSTNINLLKSHSMGSAAPHQAPGDINAIMASWYFGLHLHNCWICLQIFMLAGKGKGDETISLSLLEHGFDVFNGHGSVHRFCTLCGVGLGTMEIRGLVGSALTLAFLAWCIKKKGPLYASIFNPLMLVIVALLSSLLLNEKLHLGSVLGAVLMVTGLYMVLWGKGREAAKVGELPADESTDVIIISGGNGLQEQCSGPHGPSESKQ